MAVCFLSDIDLEKMKADEEITRSQGCSPPEDVSICESSSAAQGHGASDQHSRTFPILSKTKNIFRFFAIVLFLAIVIIIALGSNYHILDASKFTVFLKVHQKLTNLAVTSSRVGASKGNPQGYQTLFVGDSVALSMVATSEKNPLGSQTLHISESESFSKKNFTTRQTSNSRALSLSEVVRNDKQRELFRLGLKWTGSPIPRGFPQWQMLDNQFGAFVYSAHMDDADSKPLVRIIGFAMQFLPYTNVTCRFFARAQAHAQSGGSLYSIRGQLYHFRNRNGRKYIGAYVDCPLAEGSNYSLPFAVSVAKEREETENNYMLVHYSQSPEWLRQHNVTTVTGNDVAGNGSNGQKANDGASYISPSFTDGPADRAGSRWRWNVTRCIPALFKNFNNVDKLMEMVAASRAVGVQHFVFYVESASAKVLRMLQVFEAQGIAEVHPWNLHLPEKVIFYRAQFSAIQDCLYRHLASSRFLLFGDLDEVFVPRKNTTLLPMLDNVFNKRPDCGAFLVRNVFFNLHMDTQWPPADVDPTGYARSHHLNILGHIRRTVKVLPDGVRSKPAVDPRKVRTGSVHIVQTLRKGFRSCSMDPSMALLHHYRFWTKVRPDSTDYVEDPYMWQYADDIIQQVKLFGHLFNHTVDRPYP